jgi:2-keto-3-deoxy-L-arabinonate dehydratase
MEIAWAIQQHVLVHRGIIATATVRPPAQDADPGTLRALAHLLDDHGWALG